MRAENNHNLDEPFFSQYAEKETQIRTIFHSRIFALKFSSGKPSVSGQHVRPSFDRESKSAVHQRIWNVSAVAVLFCLSLRT